MDYNNNDLMDEYMKDFDYGLLNAIRTVHRKKEQTTEMNHMTYALLNWLKNRDNGGEN